MALVIAFTWLAAGCSSSPPPAPPVDADFDLRSSAARDAFNQGSYDTAADLYRQALSRAQAMDRAAQISQASYNLAICLDEMAHFAEAADLLKEAEREAARAGEPVGEIVLIEARVARSMHDSSAAALAARAIADAQAHPNLPLLVQSRVLAGQIALDGGDIAAARQDLSAATAAAGPTPLGSGVRGGMLGLAASIDLAAKDFPKAAAQFDAQADLLQSGHRYNQMRDALARSALAWSQANQPATAADRYFRAARAALGQEDFRAAASLDNSALEQAAKANAADLQSRAQLLQSDIKSAAAAATTAPAVPVIILPPTSGPATTMP
jgi:hypothetical protein